MSFLLLFYNVLVMSLLTMLAMVLLTMASGSLGTIEHYKRSDALFTLPCCTSVELSAYSGQCNKVLFHTNILSRCWLPDDQSLANPISSALLIEISSPLFPFKISSLLVLMHRCFLPAPARPTNRDILLF